MKRYTKQIDGKTVIKERNLIVINKDGTTTLFPTHEMLLEDGWVEYVIPEPTEEELLAKAKRAKVRELEAFDKSNEVNLFYIGDIGLWLKLEERVGLELRFKAEIAQGIEGTTLWYNDMVFPLAPSSALQMLYDLELYASACYDNTAKHRANINALTTIEEVEAYDYRVGYPEKLNF